MNDSIVFEQLIFDNKSFGDILRDAYFNRETRNIQVNGLIDQLKGMIKTGNDASILIPFIKEYLDIAVKNDENIIKLAGIIQRALSKTGQPIGGAGGPLFTDEEISELTSNMPADDKSELINVVNNQIAINKKVNEVQHSVDDILNEIDLNH